jgi:hypothetical protein
MQIGEIIEIGERIVETPKLKPRAPQQPSAPARKREKTPA